MADEIQGMGPIPPDVREAAKRRLAELEQESKAEGTGPLEPIDILWGWGEIAAALRVSEATAKAYYEHERLPVNIRRGKTPQSTRAALKAWAEKRKVCVECE
jgi:hypothetical protein